MPRRAAEFNGGKAMPESSPPLVPNPSLDVQHAEVVARICNWISENKDQALSRVLPEMVEHVRSLTNADGAAVALREERGPHAWRVQEIPALSYPLQPDSGLIGRYAR